MKKSILQLVCAVYFLVWFGGARSDLSAQSLVSVLHFLFWRSVSFSWLFPRVVFLSSLFALQHLDAADLPSPILPAHDLVTHLWDNVRGRLSALVLWILLPLRFRFAVKNQVCLCSVPVAFSALVSRCHFAFSAWPSVWCACSWFVPCAGLRASRTGSGHRSQSQAGPLFFSHEHWSPLVSGLRAITPRVHKQLVSSARPRSSWSRVPTCGWFSRSGSRWVLCSFFRFGFPSEFPHAQEVFVRH
jgi:hypothetical protein